MGSALKDLSARDEEGRHIPLVMKDGEFIKNLSTERSAGAARTRKTTARPSPVASPSYHRPSSSHDGRSARVGQSVSARAPYSLEPGALDHRMADGLE